MSNYDIKRIDRPIKYLSINNNNNNSNSNVPIISADYTKKESTNNDPSYLNSSSYHLDATMIHSSNKIDELDKDINKHNVSDNEYYLRREILRLTSLNNSIRLDTSKELEIIKLRENEYNILLHDKNIELKELQFLYNESNKQNSRLQEIILQMKQHINNGNTNNTLFLSNPINPTTSTNNSHIISNNSATVPILTAAEKRISTLEEQLSRLENESREYIKKVELHENELKWRDHEINRLRDLLENDRNWNKLNSESEINLLREKVSHLEDQLDFLNNERVALTNELESSKSKDVNARHIRLSKEVAQMTSKLENMHKEESNLSKKSENYNNIIFESPSEMKKLKTQISELNKTVESLKTENLALSKSSLQVSQLYDTYHSDKSVLVKEVAKKTEELDQVIDLNVTYQKEIEELNETVDLLRQECNDNKAVLDMTRDTLTFNQAASNTAVNSKLQREEALASKSNEAALLRNQLSQLEKRFETSEKSNREIESMRSNLSMKVTQLQTSHDNLSSQLQSSIFTQNMLSKERDMLKNEVNNLLVNLDEQKGETTLLEATIRDLKFKLEQCELLLKSTSNEKSELYSDFSKKMSEFYDLERDLWESQREASKLQSLVGETSSISAALSASRDANSKFQSENFKLQRELFESKSREKSRTEEVEQAKVSYEDLKREYSTLNSNYGDMLNKHSSLELILSNLSVEKDSLLRNFEDLKGDLDENNRRDRGRDERSNRNLDMMAKIQQELADERQKNSTVNLELQKKVKEVRDLFSKVEKFQSERDLVTERFHTLQVETQSLKEDLIQIKSEKMILADTGDDRNKHISNLEASIRELKIKVSSLESENSEIKIVWKQSDSSRIQFERIVSEKTSENRTLLDQISSLKSQINSYEDKFNQMQKDYAQLKQTLRILDSKHDQLQSELDIKAEQINSLEQAKLALDKSIMEKSSQIQLLQSQLNHAGENIRSKEKELYANSLKLEKVSTDKNKVDDENRVKIQEIRTLADDVANMTKENQYLNGELQRVSTSFRNLNIHMEQLNFRIHTAEEKGAILENEKIQLLHQYRAVCNENTRLEQAFHSISVEKQEHASESKQLKEMHSQHILKLQEFDSNIRRLHSDISILESQAQKSNRELASLQIQNESLKNQLNETSHKSEMTRQISMRLESEKDEAGRNNYYFMAENKSLKANLQDNLAQCNALESKFQAENQRCKNLETIIANQRMKEQNTLSAATALSRDIAQVNDAKRMAQSDLQNLQQHVDSFQRSIKREVSAMQALFSQYQSGSLPRDSLDNQIASRINSLVDSMSNFTALIDTFERQINARSSNEVSMVSNKHIENILSSPAPGSYP